MNKLYYNDKVFYIYYLGRYRNKHHYTYGISTDLYSTELRIISNLPTYKLLTYYPTDYQENFIEKFEYITKKYKCSSPIIGLQDMNFISFNENKNRIIIKIVDSYFPHF
jgi:hypothetical protein